MTRLTLADRIFRAVLRLYPAEFRGDFGDDMSADFNDQRREAWRTAGFRGLAGLWLATLADALRRAPREQLALVMEDVRFAGRMMRRHAASTAVIVLLLAMGIGANVAVFGFAEPWIRRPLPVPHGRDLVRIVKLDAEAPQQFPYAVFRDIAARSQSFAGVAAHQYTTVAFGRGETARPLDGEVVSGNYFDVLGVQPQLGRLLRPGDDRDLGSHPVVVISHGAWRELLAGAPDVVGRLIHLNGHPFEVVGVAPRGFSGSYTAFSSRFWAPIAMYKQVRPQELPLTHRGWSWLSVTARLRAGVGIDDAAADLRRVHGQLQREFPNTTDASGYAALRASGLPEALRESAGMMIAFAAAVAALLLLVTCANVAGVLQSRAMARIRETSIRFALGATRLRVMRQWLTESVCLALLGAAGGLAVGQWLDSALVALIGNAAPFEVSTPRVADPGIVLFTMLVGIVSGLAFGLFPAWRSASRGERTLREQATTLAGTPWGVRSTRALVALQVCASVALIVTAGLLTRSMRNATAFDIGFDTSGLVGADLQLRRYGYDRARSTLFVDRLLAELRVQPGVAAASRASVVPLAGNAERLGFRIPGYAAPNGAAVLVIDANAVSSGYFDTLGIPIREGRDLADTDDARADGVAVVNETMAARFWPGRSAVGQTIIPADKGARPLRIIGVVKDIKYYSLEEPPRPYVYLSAGQSGLGALVIHVRTTGSETAAIQTIKRIVTGLDASVVVDQAMTFEELRRQPLAGRRAMMTMANAFSALALLLTLVGIYGTMSNAVGQRSREIGVRMAFGADVAQVLRLVAGDGLKPVVPGVVLGLVAAGFGARLVSSELFGVTAGDPVTYGVAVLVVFIGAGLALVLPARRAARVDPVAVLRD
jgi:predicted permease